jgi:ribosomal protein S18 acetylase RimI-like enzyme
MFIENAVEANDELLSALENLIPQLGGDKIPPSQAELAALLDSKSSTLLLARYPNEGGEIVGALTLAIYRVPTGVRSIVEDLIVDQRFRRLGIARALMGRAVDLARWAGAANVSLSSAAHREAANTLYYSLGFQLRQSNFYILHLL